MMALVALLEKEKQLQSVCPHSLTMCCDSNVTFSPCVGSLGPQVGSGLEMAVDGGNNSLRLGMGMGSLAQLSSISGFSLKIQCDQLLASLSAVLSLPGCLNLQTTSQSDR